MKEIGAQPLMKNGLNYKKALTLLGFLVDDRGQVTVPNAPANVPIPAPVARRIGIKRPARDDERPSMVAPYYWVLNITLVFMTSDARCTSLIY